MQTVQLEMTFKDEAKANDVIGSIALANHNIFTCYPIVNGEKYVVVVCREKKESDNYLNILKALTITIRQLLITNEGTDES